MAFGPRIAVIMLTSADHLLTILVPTFNRGKKVRELLEVLVPAVQQAPEVDLIVSSNGSKDETAEVLRQFADLPRVRIVEQPINYGMHIHLAWLYGQARGVYLWMIGDDDMIEPGLLGQVCQKLRDEPMLGWIHLPHAFHPGGGELMYSLRPDNDTHYACSRELFPPYIRWLTFITANVIRSELLQRHLPRLAFDNYFWPASLLMMAVADSPACVLADCKIKAGQDLCTWHDKLDEVVDFHFPRAILDAPVLSRKEKQACLTWRYEESPPHLDKLVLVNRPLLFKVFCAAPNLCNLGFFLRVMRKACRAVFIRRGKSLK